MANPSCKTISGSCACFDFDEVRSFDKKKKCCKKYKKAKGNRCKKCPGRI